MRLSKLEAFVVKAIGCFAGVAVLTAITVTHGDARLTWPFGTSLCPLKLQKLREDVMNAHLMRLSLRRLF
jgi:hypothetical protein